MEANVQKVLVYPLVDVIIWPSVRRVEGVVVLADTVAAPAQVPAGVDVESVEPWLEAINGPINNAVLAYL